jgi:hypothetical protein
MKKPLNIGTPREKCKKGKNKVLKSSKNRFYRISKTFFFIKILLGTI